MGHAWQCVRYDNVWHNLFTVYNKVPKRFVLLINCSRLDSRLTPKCVRLADKPLNSRWRFVKIFHNILQINLIISTCDGNGKRCPLITVSCWRCFPGHCRIMSPLKLVNFRDVQDGASGCTGSRLPCHLADARWSNWVISELDSCLSRRGSDAYQTVTPFQHNIHNPRAERKYWTPKH